MKDKEQKNYSVPKDLEDQMKDHLQSKQPLFGKDSPFSELLQGMVNQMLDGEMEAFQDEEKASGKPNKRNGHTSKRVLSESGLLFW